MSVVVVFVFVFGCCCCCCCFCFCFLVVVVIFPSGKDEDAKARGCLPNLRVPSGCHLLPSCGKALLASAEPRPERRGRGKDQSFLKKGDDRIVRIASNPMQMMMIVMMMMREGGQWMRIEEYEAMQLEAGKFN